MWISTKTERFLISSILLVCLLAVPALADESDDAPGGVAITQTDTPAAEDSGEDGVTNTGDLEASPAEPESPDDIDGGSPSSELPEDHEIDVSSEADAPAASDVLHPSDVAGGGTVHNSEPDIVFSSEVDGEALEVLQAEESANEEWRNAMVFSVCLCAGAVLGVNLFGRFA